MSEDWIARGKTRTRGIISKNIFPSRDSRPTLGEKEFLIKIIFAVCALAYTCYTYTNTYYTPRQSRRGSQNLLHLGIWLETRRSSEKHVDVGWILFGLARFMT